MKEKSHIMIDIETYSIASNGVIRSIAAVLFDMFGNTKVLIDCGIEVESCLLAGLAIDQDTVNFWRNQPSGNRERLLSKPKDSLRMILPALSNYVYETVPDKTELYVWSHGSNFDLVLLENAYKAIGEKAFWEYKNVRDTRTLFDVADYQYKAKGSHDALEDAMNQTKAVCEAYNKLRSVP